MSDIQRGIHVIARGLITAWLVVLTELVAVMLIAKGQLAGIWEIQYGTLWASPALLLLSAAGGAIGLALWSALASNAFIGRASASGLGALLGAAAGFSVTTGRHFELLWRRAGFVTLCAGVAALGLLWFRPHFIRWCRSRSKFGLAIFIATIVALEVLNRWVLVRLYPGFHVSLAVAALVLAPAVAVLTAPSVGEFQPGQRLSWARKWGPSCAVSACLVLSLVCLKPAADKLALFDNYRWVIAEQAPIARHAILLGSWLAPPPSLDDSQAGGKHVSAGQGARLDGVDILLITVDALRADHLGAYGYERKLTPNMDALAAGGLRFERAYCPTPHTSYSVTSMMTGKYVRPLLLQGAGAHSETLAGQLRRYGYRTGAFYPPAIFFIDKERFSTFSESQLGFEYQKREFLEGEERVLQLTEYVESQPEEMPVFAWVHLFGPHEPYERQPAFDFGERDIDIYDSEVAAADRTVGRLVEEFRKRRPGALVILSSDHGEEFGDHGGRYHGSSVYEEQVRVPLLVSAPDRLKPAVIEGPVQTIDLLPTLLSTLGIPVRPSVRGRDLAAAWRVGSLKDKGFAFAETEEHTLLAEGQWRLICARRVGACRLYNLHEDPAQQRDVSREHPDVFKNLRAQTQGLNASHGRYEREGLRAEGRGWPGAVLRGLAGDGDAAPELAELLDDADVAVRRKSAELLFELGTLESSAALRLALQREDDIESRQWSALALTRLGEGAPLTIELTSHTDRRWRRLAALALAEGGDGRAIHHLVEWWMSKEVKQHTLSVRLLDAFARVRAKEAVWPILQSLGNLRLRPKIADTLAVIGEDSARGPLAKALREERYHGTRRSLAAALVKLGAAQELVSPFRRWLGVPDPLPQGMILALEAGILEYLGGPTKKGLQRLRKNAALGELVTLVVPPGEDELQEVRLFLLASNGASQTSQVRIGLPHKVFSFDNQGAPVKSRKVPEIHPVKHLSFQVEAQASSVQYSARVPKSWGLEPGRASHLVVYAERGLMVEAVAALPLRTELSSAEDPARGAKATKTGD